MALSTRAVNASAGIRSPISAISLLRIFSSKLFMGDRSFIVILLICMCLLVLIYWPTAAPKLDLMLLR